ncbi:MAG TPA: hypothetical protein VLL75_09545 [Vicinamibacteria bacterium]|nr:hypothetical protein [Vicinamibacteria bacterium]
MSAWSARRAEALAFGLVAACVVGKSLEARPRVVGDGAEYFLVAEALSRHRSPDLRAGDREAVWQRLAAEGIDGAAHLAEVPVLEAGNGRSYTIHFWGYPLATLPARLALGVLGVSALKAPQVTNAFLFTAAIGVVLFQAPLPAFARRTFATLSLLSPALWFVVWPHPEVFSFSLATVALVWRAAARSEAAILAAAVASVQNPPLALLAVATWCEAALASFRRGGWRASPDAALLALALLPAAVPSAFYLWRFGTPSLLARGALDPANLSLGRTLELLFDLNLGLLPYAPFVLVASLGYAFTARGCRWGWGLALAMAFACTATCNWNSGTSGPARYAVWIYPLLLDGFVGLLGRSATDGPPP